MFNVFKNPGASNDLVSGMGTIVLRLRSAQVRFDAVRLFREPVEVLCYFPLKKVDDQSRKKMWFQNAWVAPQDYFFS